MNKTIRLFVSLVIHSAITIGLLTSCGTDDRHKISSDEVELPATSGMLKASISEPALECKLENIDEFVDIDLLAKHDIDKETITKYSLTTMQIHESIPTLTFYRVVRGINQQSDIEFPEPKNVEIIINDADRIVQIIPDLTQSAWFAWNSELSFSDYNFDGYLDMRLKRWQEGAGHLLANEYFWLWDSAVSQFVLNEQLMEIGRAADLFANQETLLIEVWHRTGAGETGFMLNYQYYDGKFIMLDMCKN